MSDHTYIVKCAKARDSVEILRSLENCMIKYTKRFACGLAVALGFFLAVEGILWVSGVVPLYERADPYVGFSGS